MRIVVNDIAASKTGALAILLDFYEYVKNHGKEHEWIFLTGVKCIDNPPENIRVIIMDHVKKSQKDRLKFDLLTGSDFLERLEPDVIFSLQNTLTRGKIRRLNPRMLDGKIVAAKGDKVPQVLYVHQPLGFQKLKRFSFLKREEREYATYQYLIGALIDASVKRADKIIVQTQWMKEAVKEKLHIDDAKIEKVLPDVASVAQYAPSDINDTFDCKHFFFPSGEILYKNHECAIKAAAILNERGYKDFKIHFTLKGLSDVTDRKYDDPYGNIVWSGRIERAEVLKEYTKGTLLFPSYIETFGVPLAEARQMKTLVLASDCPFSHEVLEGYNNAYYFNPFSPAELADLMEKVIVGELKPFENTEEASEVQSREYENGYERIVRIIEDAVDYEG